LKALLQRVTEAAVSVAGEQIAAIGPGLLVLLGVSPADDAEAARWLADKTLHLRIFADADKPMNRDVMDVGGEILVVSQFTLTADTRRGRRPSFTSAAPPEQAQRLYQAYLESLRKRYKSVAEGRFGADMQVSLTNDGPVTFMLENPFGDR
jgi:D-tyrosyl-tRNA(Tyr) deacylase